MPSEQEPSLCIQKTSLLQDNAMDRTCVPASDIVVEESTPQPAISDVLFYGLKNVKIELPRVNIPNEVICTHEIDRYMKLFQCKEKHARAPSMHMDVNGSNLNCSEIYIPHSKPGPHNEEGLKTSAKILNFSCTKCRNNVRYSPNDLQKHFQLLHHGELPSYPCEMCNFSANDFQSFNQHRRTHRSTLVKCEICNDDSRYTLLDLTKHFTSRHCVNGHFQCERCRFSTQDVGTFVQHIHRHNEIQYKCDKCHHASFSKEESQKHVASHTGTFPFSCQYCNYMASRKNYLLKHIITLHRDHLYAKDKMDTDNHEKKMKTSTGLKLILKRYKTGASRKALWRRKRMTSSSCRIGEEDRQMRNMKEIQPKSEEQGRSTKELHLNEDHSLLNEKHVYSGAKSSPAIQYSRAEDGLGSGLLKKAVHGPTVLMVKNNKISVPANYSAKFMGFKIVDGKQHIVIKLLPTDRQNLPAENKVDGVKDGSTECLQRMTDSFDLSSGAGPHEITQQMFRNNSVHSLTSSLSSSNQYSGKIKQESTNYFSLNTTRTDAPPLVVVGNCATRLSLKPDSSLPCDFVTKAGSKDTVSWRNCVPQDHPRVLSSAATHMLHYDPMKKPFPPELKVRNGEINNNSKYNNLYCPSTDFPNQVPLPFHNYSKTDILDNSKDRMSSSTFPLQSRCVSETAYPQQPATALNLERSSLLSLHGFVNTSNTPVFSTNQPNYAVDRQHCIENNHDGQQCLNTKVNQGLEHISEKFKQENASECVNASFMPKITSVFSLQSTQASSYLSPEVNKSLQDVLKGQPASQPHNYIKSGYNNSFPNHKMDCKTLTHFKNSAAASSLTHSPVTFKRERNMNGSATNEGVYFRNEGRVPMTYCRTEEINSTSRTTGIGTLLKTQKDSIITHQLEKDKMYYRFNGPNVIRPALPEQKKSVLLQSSLPRFFVPLRLAHQQGLQVISGKPSPKTSSSDVQATRATPLLLNKGPGMILTFGSGSIGTISNATENSSQVLEKIAFKECGKEAIATSGMELKIDSSGSIRNSGISVCNGTAGASSTGMPHKEQLNITNSENRISSVKILAGYQGSNVATLESIKQPEIGLEQPVFALLPDGRQAVFLKCMSPNKSLVQNRNIFQGTAYSQNSEPKKPGAIQQKLFLKIKTFPAADNCQPVSNVVSSLQFNNMHSLNSSALDQKKTALSPSDALLFPSRLTPANACLASDKSRDPFTSVESVHSSRHVKTRSQKTPSDSAQTVSANKGSNFGTQISTGTTTNKMSKAKRHSKQTGAKVSDATVSQKNRNLKRKAKDDLQEPPRKKILHRKCKEKNQMNVNEFESLMQAPYRLRVSKDTVRILKLLPFNSKQLIKCPRRNQPVVVLNHPDADVPEVVNVMKTIAKFKGHVLKVSLSKRTIDALLEPPYYSNSLYIVTNDLSRRKRKMLKPVSPVKERFVLKLTLKKTSKNNYQIVKTTSDNTLKTKFNCWFCGRIFDNQDNWVGHGQRHLMEATRDWNSLG
ncbi:zinc finger protein 518A [Rhineura floridana]|uniref:zinc finger protein 518A n=1 Tax=Rhineura floridana TaxID=261503 RepID=UPI002AC875A5|nr:zinc finger protein 518A [Rhineura floridana]XP_061491552.1 zinc finger protein 518A [Rhineura floridana]XP_061491553.1 zinc finger protein 518A [Rhineura floridana]XP_061491554.1 zinc finger protein 518A [Rhineura floridana]